MELMFLRLGHYIFDSVRLLIIASKIMILVVLAIGLLIGMEDVPLEKQSEYLSGLLTPLCQQVEGALINAKNNPEGSLAQIEIIQQIIMAINALSKGFNERLVIASRITVGLMFKKTLDVLLQVLVVFPKVESLQPKVVSFIHRIVDTLGVLIFPYLPKTLGQLLTEIEELRMAMLPFYNVEAINFYNDVLYSPRNWWIFSCFLISLSANLVLRFVKYWKKYTPLLLAGHSVFSLGVILSGPSSCADAWKC